MEIGVPDLETGLAFEPALVDKQTVDDACSIVLATSFFSSLDNLASYDTRVRLGDQVLFEFARDALNDQVAQAESDLGDFFGWDGGRNAFIVVDGEN